MVHYLDEDSGKPERARSRYPHQDSSWAVDAFAAVAD